MTKISKDLIATFSESANQVPFKNSYNVIASFIEEAMNNIMSRNSFIQSYNMVIANEVFSGTEIPGSNLEIFLMINAKQLELNYKEQKNYPIKNVLNNFVKSFKDGFSIFKRKKIKPKKLKKVEQKIITNENYNVLSFYQDLQLQIQKQLYVSSKIGITKNAITIVGDEEFGPKIYIYPVFTSNAGLPVIYNLRNKKTTSIDFNERFYNIENMNKKTRSLFKIQVRIFNNIYYNMFKIPANQIFMESLIFNVPTKFYTLNIYETTVSIINYLKNCNLNKFVSICNQNTNLFVDPLNTTLLENAYRFIKSIAIDEI